MTTISIDNSRAQATVEKIRARANEIAAFVNEKTLTLHACKSKIEAFTKEFNAKSIEIGNMYSTGMTDGEYKEGCQLIAHCKMELSKEYKNTDLLASKLNNSWSSKMNGKEDTKIRAQFNGWKIKGTIVEFQIWIY